MKWLFGGNQQQQSPPIAPASSLRVQTSAQGTEISLFLGGQVRLSGNIIWYGDFQQHAQYSQGGGGGKGGGGSGNAPQLSGYTYSASFMTALCEGAISQVINVWNNKSKDTLFAQNLTAFLGDYTQAAWGYLTTNHPDVALTYRGIVYMAASNYDLGSNQELPQLSFDCLHTNNGAIPGLPDADVSVCTNDLLTNVHYGVNFPSARIGDLSQWSNYSRAIGIVVSPAITNTTTGQQVLTDFCEATNTDPRWSNGKLDFVPRGDQAISLGQVLTTLEADTAPSADPYQVTVGRASTFVTDQGVKFHISGIALVKVDSAPAAGQYAVSTQGVYTFNPADAAKTIDITYSYAATASFQPDNEPEYDFTYKKYVANQGSMGNASGPLQIQRVSRDDLPNVVRVEILDRTNEYNALLIEDQDEASIAAFGRKRVANTKSWHFICDQAAGRISAALLKQRSQIPRTYQWTVGRRFILLDVADKVTVSDPAKNLSRVLVKITEIQENSDRTLTFTAEDFPGTASAPKYGLQASAGALPNYNADPGSVNVPFIFEPTDQATGGAGLQVWASISGELAIWGGCNVLASYDGNSYDTVATVRGSARQGVLSADLATFAINPTGQTIDNTNTLSVDLTQSRSSLLSGTVLDATSLNTACYIEGGEFVAYQNAVLTAQYKYGLTYLVRGAYGSESDIALHPAGSKFTRLDQGIAKFAFDKTRVGANLFLKFQSFNQWGGGIQDVSTLPVYTYTITGVALTSPLPNVANVRTTFEAGFQKIWWDDVVDFRSGIRYKIYKGDSFAGAQQVGDVAHAPFVAFGAGVYWIVGYCQPTPDLYVYSETPQTLTISGNMLIANLLHTSDQQAAGWPGIFDNGVGIDGPDIRLGGSGNILGITSFLTTPDILNYGGVVASGTYEISPADYIDAGYIAQCYVNATWKSTGVPVGQDILSVADFLNMPDVLGAASAPYVSVKVQIATSTTGAGDIFAAPDVFAISDPFSYGIGWGAWQDYVPGVYLCRYIKFRLVLETIDPNTIPYVLAFSYDVSVPARIDHYQNLNVPLVGLTVTFVPDSQNSAAPFNGGPPLGGLNNQPLPFVNFSVTNQAGVHGVIDSLTLGALTFHLEDNAGVHVASAASNVNVTVEGY